MRNRVTFALLIVTVLVIVPVVHGQNLGQYDTFKINVQGSGKVYWSSSYDGVAYSSGSTVTGTSISVPHGAVITFTAVPDEGHDFYSWIVDTFDQGSNNPFIMYGTGEASTATIVADFGQDFAANPPLQTPVLQVPVQYDTFKVDVQGAGRVYWSANYDSSAYTSGSTETAISIRVPHGTMVTFTAVPADGNQLNDWNMNSFNQGSSNPFIIYGTGETSTATVIADFGQI